MFLHSSDVDQSCVLPWLSLDLLCVLNSQDANTHTCIHTSVSLSVSRAQSERNPWVVLTSALLTRCQGSEGKLDLGQQVVTMVRSLYNAKHKLPAEVNSQHFLDSCV